MTAMASARRTVAVRVSEAAEFAFSIMTEPLRSSHWIASTRGLSGVLPGSVKQLCEPLAGLRCQPEFARVWPSLDLDQCLFAPPLEQQKKLAVQRPDPFDEVQPLGKWATGAESLFAEHEQPDA